ncbi:MAG: carbohydrate kinase family protein [Sulfolobus sp.]|nr:carbohydrate kinase family protein [Sulfolobus sp.]
MKPVHLSVGKLNIDILVKADRVPDPDHPAYTDILEILPGGAATNYAVAVSRLGHSSKILARVSRNPIVKTIMSLLADSGVGLEYVHEMEGPTNSTLIFIRDDGKVSMIRKQGVSMAISAEDVKQLFGLFDVIHFASVSPNVVVRDPNARWVSYDPGPFAGELKELPQLDVLFLNEAEFSRLNVSGLKAKYVAVKMGSKGAIVIGENERCTAKALKVKAVDTTGAGDVFDAAFNVAMMEGWDLKDALAFAVVASGLKVTRLGGISSPTLEETLSVMKTQNVELSCE